MENKRILENTVSFEGKTYAARFEIDRLLGLYIATLEDVRRHRVSGEETRTTLFLRSFGFNQKAWLGELEPSREVAVYLGTSAIMISPELLTIAFSPQFRNSLLVEIRK